MCYECYSCALTYTDIHTDTSDNIIITFPLMENTNIMTDYAQQYM